MRIQIKVSFTYMCTDCVALQLDRLIGIDPGPRSFRCTLGKIASLFRATGIPTTNQPYQFQPNPKNDGVRISLVRPGIGRLFEIQTRLEGSW